MSTYLIIEFGKDFWSGGLGDRIVGLCSAILLSKAIGKKLLIKWDHPNVINVLDFGEYDYYKYNVNENMIILNTIDNRTKYKEYFSEQPIQTIYKNNNIIFRCNQEVAIFLYSNRHLNISSDYNSDLLNAYKEIFTKYIKIVNLISQNIDPPYLAIQIRTGDTYLNVGDFQPVKDITFTCERIAQYVKTFLTNYKFIYLSSDNSQVPTVLANLLPNFNILSCPQSCTHLERSKTSPNDINYLISDLITLSRGETLIISTYSNYGRIAALISSDCKNLLGINQHDFGISNLNIVNLFSKHEI